MAETSATTQITFKPKRPVGVWILTIYAAIFAGISPLLVSVYLLISGNTAGNTIGLLISTVLNLAVILSAIGAWQGKPRARLMLLIFVTLNYVLIGLNNFLVISSGQVPVEDQAQFWGRMIRGVLYPAIYIWYFNKYTTKEFYGS